MHEVRLGNGARRVAVVAEDAWDIAPTRWLPFVSCEAELSRLLWGSRSDPAGGPVDTLLLIGHGMASLDGTWQASGVLSGGALDSPELLTGDKVVERWKGVRRIFVNACVLGRTRSYLGESIGMLDRLFRRDSSIRSAIGAVRLVGDFEAMLVSLAFQHRLHAHDRTGTAPEMVRWAAVFADVQRCLDAGHWPDGFADWLRTQLPCALTSHAVVPPERRWRWFALLNGDGRPGSGVFSRLGLPPMQAGPRGAWQRDLEGMAERVTRDVPVSVRHCARCYTSYGD